MAKRFMQPKLAEKFESVALSHQTVARRIDDMDNYIWKSLCDRFVDCEYYSICLDESTDQTDKRVSKPHRAVRGKNIASSNVCLLPLWSDPAAGPHRNIAHSLVYRHNYFKYLSK
ncbi:hypothetical protein EVAR_77740_1 [Eumeta japonica]|uniref:Zinc finger BED domain-containing protein 5 n=1 Tax=Eumeta variegata TaxID=151549 RepID=A0A4C1TBW6_EUMVA|nr:hypothetical protein EVAR_77740_1 [Eumeta japonica]